MNKQALTVVFITLTLTVVLSGIVATEAVNAETAAAVLTRESQAAITPARALQMLKQGNERFSSDGAGQQGSYTSAGSCHRSPPGQ